MERSPSKIATDLFGPYVSEPVLTDAQKQLGAALSRVRGTAAAWAFRASELPDDYVEMVTSPTTEPTTEAVADKDDVLTELDYQG